MMIKVSNELLEFDELIEVEKQIKLFEEISTTDGDFSYAFELQKTLTNTRILQNPLPDNISKPVYQKIPAKLLSDGGAETYNGYLRIERITEVYHCSFFAGNNNWFGMLSGKLRDIDWSAFDRDQTEINLSYAIFDSSGTVFPMVDNGMLAYRGNALMKVEDFMGAIYTKDIVNKIFAIHGIKIQGELFNDVDYLSSVVLSNAKSTVDIEARTTKAHTTNSPNPHDATYHKMVWTNDSDYPYSDGAANLFDLATGRYTADVKMRAKVNLVIKQILGTTTFALKFKMAVYVNGVLYAEQFAPFGGSEVQTLNMLVPLNAGDYLEIFTFNNAVIWDDPIVDADLEITPVFLYKAFGRAIVPNWTQGEFVAAIFQKWNVLAYYNAQTMTLTCNLFEKIKTKPAIDLSEYISEVEVDYTEFISEYGKKSFLSHEQIEEDDEFRKLNLTRRDYTKGQINVDNDYLEDEVDILESKFAAPITYLNPVFGMSMEKTDLITLEEDLSVEIVSVTDSLGRARFTIAEDIFALSDMVRITDSINPSYNGDWMVITLGAGYVELEGLAFDTDSGGQMTKLNFAYTDSDKVFLLHNVPLYEVNKFSGLSQIQVENTDYANLSLGYYNIIRTNRPVDTDLPFSMAFEPGDQVSFKERYFRLFSKVLNDPVKIICTAHIPYQVYLEIDFLRPIKILTEQTTNVYYLNRITGYKDSFLECQLNLIKI